MRGRVKPFPKRVDEPAPNVSTPLSAPANNVETREPNDTTETTIPPTIANPTSLFSADGVICNPTDALPSSNCLPSEISQKLVLPVGVKPYYLHDGIAIIHGDCREIMPLLPKVNLVLTDPPYGVSHNALHGSNGSKMWGSEKIIGDEKPFDPKPLLTFPRLIIWGANNFASRLPDSAGWIVWDKSPKGIRKGFVYSHAELAWTNLIGHVEKIECLWEGASRQGEEFLHPTQKPVGLMRELIKQFSSEADVILDPFMGSGTTLRAAKDLRRKAIGIEIEEKYCEIAAKRLEQEGFDFT